jgi:hypothetical protein
LELETATSIKQQAFFLGGIVLTGWDGVAVSSVEMITISEKKALFIIEIDRHYFAIQSLDDHDITLPFLLCHY